MVIPRCIWPLDMLCFNAWYLVFHHLVCCVSPLDVLCLSILSDCVGLQSLFKRSISVQCMYLLKHRAAKAKGEFWAFAAKGLFLRMQLSLIAIGKTDSADLERLIGVYERRLTHYIKFHFYCLADVKNTKHLSQAQQRAKEGERLLSQIQPSDVLMLLDERGQSLSSVAFAQFLQKKMNSGIKSLVLAIGGPYGFSEAVYQRSAGAVSLSAMTFSHQIVRLFAVEQLYRSFTILRNEPYHHG